MISVCMASYNGEKYIREQLDSILKQLSPEDEIVISDDGSTDKTCIVIKSINDSRIKLIFNEGKHGFTHNFENALSHAKGDVIFLSDQDDIWRDNKVEVTMRELKDCDFVISDCITVDDTMNILQESRFEAFNIKNGFLQHLIKSRYLGCCMAFKKYVADIALPFPINDDLVEHDIWLAAVALFYFKTTLVKEPLILYRRHGNNTSDGGFDRGYSFLNKIYRRLYRLKELFLRGNKVYRRHKEFC